MWQSETHPNGRLYFYRSADSPSNSYPALTNSVLFYEPVRARAESAFSRISKRLETFADVPSDTIIVLDVRLDADWYYCASWSLRKVFWPESTDITISSGSIVPVFDFSHLSTSTLLYGSVPTHLSEPNREQERGALLDACVHVPEVWWRKRTHTRAEETVKLCLSW